MQIRSFINKEYIPELLYISYNIEKYKDLWYNGHIIGLVHYENGIVVKFNNFAKIHCSIDEDKDTFVVDGEIELHQKLAEFDFSTLNKGLI